MYRLLQKSHYEMEKESGMTHLLLANALFYLWKVIN